MIREQNMKIVLGIAVKDLTERDYYIGRINTQNNTYIIAGLFHS